MNIVLIDDDHSFSEIITKFLFENGNYVFYYDNPFEVYSSFRRLDNIDLVIIDLMLAPSFSEEGLSILAFIRSANPDLPVIMISQRNDQMTSIVDSAFSMEIVRFLDKNDSNFWIKLINTVKELEEKMNDKIFISHGHNELLKYKLKDFIQNTLHREPLILSEMPNNGMTVVEKLEAASKLCNVAIVLLTKDDETKEGGMRARQNVIHEIGFFQGKYGRQKVILLREQGVEIFSNISGILRIEFTSSHFEEIYDTLRRELE